MHVPVRYIFQSLIYPAKRSETRGRGDGVVLIRSFSHPFTAKYKGYE